MTGKGRSEGSSKGVSGGQHIDTMKPGYASGEIGGVKFTGGKVDPEKVFKAEPLFRRDREEEDPARQADDRQEEV
jgi:hypothetical protein